MGLDIIGGKTERTILSALNGLSARQRVIGNNVANIETPGFKGAEVNFESRLQQAITQQGKLAMATTNPLHLATDSSFIEGAVEVVPTNNTTMRNDGNNVDIDREMARLAETTLTYNALTQLMAKKLAGIKAIVQGGR